MKRIEEKLKHMTRDQKYEEFRSYLTSAGFLRLDIDQIKTDQAALGAPDSALDEAIRTCARMAGGMLGKEPMTAQELAETLKNHSRDTRHWLHDRAIASHNKATNFRKRQSPSE